MDLKTKVAKADELLNTIATHDDEEHSAVIVALEHVKKCVDMHIKKTNERRNAKAAELAASFSQAAAE